METRTYEVYKFNELPAESRKKAIEKYYDINVDYDWWQYTYEDAETIGLKISEFDIDRASFVKGVFTAPAGDVAKAIFENHGEQCETYKTAKAYINCVSALDPEGEDYEELLADCDRHFLKSLCEDYRILLQKEYEYRTSEEAIMDSLVINDYDFTLEGVID